MASKAKRSFDDNCRDVDRLLKIHKYIAGDKPGRKWGVEVLNKSAVVLISAYWEAYNEDVCEEAIEHLCAHAQDACKLPDPLRKAIAKKIRESAHDLAPWGLAGDGWKSELKANVSELKKARTANLNTPKSGQLRDLFAKALGITDITESWKRPYMRKDKACQSLDEFVALRGAIAHRGKAAGSVGKHHPTKFLALVRELVGRTDNMVDGHVHSITGKNL